MSVLSLLDLILYHDVSNRCRDFNRTNGRHVMHPEDILPVAKEYQRYKVV